MTQGMHFTDDTRLKILDALRRPGAVQVNAHRVKKMTGYHAATVKASLDYLAKEGVLLGFGPRLNPGKLGFGLNVLTLFQGDVRDEKEKEKALKIIQADDNLLDFGEVIGSGYANYMIHEQYRNIEEYHRSFDRKYFKQMPQLKEIIRDRQIFFLTGGSIKKVDAGEAALNALLKERGLAIRK